MRVAQKAYDKRIILYLVEKYNAIELYATYIQKYSPIVCVSL